MYILFWSNDVMSVACIELPLVLIAVGNILQSILLVGIYKINASISWRIGMNLSERYIYVLNPLLECVWSYISIPTLYIYL